MRDHPILTSLLLLLASFNLNAADTEEPRRIGPVSIPTSDQYSLPSSLTDQRYRIQVLNAPGSGAAGESFPVVYLLDAEFLLLGLADDLKLLTQSGLVPPVIVVGIAIDLEDLPPRSRFPEYARRRTWHYTPTHDAAFSESQPLMNRTGGAGKFLAFLNEELKPFINERYPVDPDRETLAGYSFSGLFTLYALFKAPHTADAYLAGSPSLWWDDKMMFRLEEDYARNKRDLPVRVLLSAGELEQATQMGPLEVSILSDMQAFHERLQGRGYPGLEMSRQIVPGMDHGAGATQFLYQGLRQLYRDGE